MPGTTCSPRAPRAGSSGGQEFGTAVHEVFEQIEWCTVPPTWRATRTLLPWFGNAWPCRKSRGLFTREKRGGRSPARVARRIRGEEHLVERDHRPPWCRRTDAGGGFRKAVLIDFKTDRVENAAILRDRYSEQLTIYRSAISTAIKLGDDQVEVVLLSTCLGELVRL